MTTYYCRCEMCGKTIEPYVSFKRYGNWYKKILRCPECNSSCIKKRIEIHDVHHLKEKEE